MNAAAETVAPKPRKPRGPRKSTLAALEAEYQRGERDGYHKALNLPRDRWPGAIAATLLAVGTFCLGVLVG